SYVKGCYLGQEVVERMRSRGVVANRLVSLRFPAEPEAQAKEPQPITLKSGDAEVGRVTSIVHSPTLNAWIGLGYVRSSHATPGTRLTVSGGRTGEAEVTALPLF